MSELSGAISIPISTASRWADWMIEGGFARRIPDRDDRRIIRISLTESGHRLLEIIDKHMAENARRILDCLTAEEQTILLVIFEKVAKGLQGAKE
jgi:DNA-binding MarR family transcriptional regulator